MKFITFTKVYNSGNFCVRLLKRTLESGMPGGEIHQVDCITRGMPHMGCFLLALKRFYETSKCGFIPRFMDLWERSTVPDQFRQYSEETWHIRMFV